MVFKGIVRIKRIARGDCFYDVTKIEDITSGNIGQAILKNAAKSTSNVFIGSVSPNGGSVKPSAKNSQQKNSGTKGSHSAGGDITESSSPHAERAVEVFGLTNDLSHAGFVLPSGQMPNLSEYGLPGVQHKLNC